MDYEREFIQHLAQHGVIIKGIVINSKTPVRHGKDKTGWAFLNANEEGAVGTWGDWKTGESYEWLSKRKQQKTLTAEEKADILRKRQEDEAQRFLELQQKHENARETALKLWGGATTPKNNNYAVRKQIEPFLARQSFDGKLLIPIYDQNKRLVNVQRIAEDGSKKFLKDAQIAGCFCVIGKIKSLVIIAEGYATAVSIHMATGHPVIVAFNAGNLSPVAKFFLGNQKIRAIIIATDNDRSGRGLIDAMQALRLSPETIRLCVCPAGEGFLSPTLKGMDFNDLHVLRGLKAVKAVFDAVELPIAYTGFMPSSKAMLEDKTADDWNIE